MTVSKTAPRWKRLASGDRRAQILREARRLFQRRTYSDVSTDDVAQAAGVTRGLVHHYFGTKRKLFLEVARDTLANAPRLTAAEKEPSRSLEEAVAHGVDVWLDAIEADPDMFLAVFGAEGLGRDRALERILSESRDLTVNAIIAVLGLKEVGDEVHGALRAYAGLVEAATREWIHRRSLDRRQAHRLLCAALLAIIDSI